MSRHVDNLLCWSCHASLAEVPQPISRHDYCPSCSEVLHCCRLCALFDPDAVDACREDRAEPPNSKTEANFCDYFEPQALRFADENPVGATLASKAEQELASLFGETDTRAADAGSDPDVTDAQTNTESDAPNDPKAALEALFNNKD